MKLTAVGEDVFIGPASQTRKDRALRGLGIKVADGETVEVADELLFIYGAEIQNRVDAGVLTIDSFSTSIISGVSQGEMNQFIEGLFSIVVDDSTVVAATTPTSAEVETAVEAPFDLRVNNVLKIKFDDIANESYDLTVELKKKIYDQAGLVTDLNADPKFTVHGVAANGTGDAVKITARSFGANSQIDIGSGHAFDANTILQFPATDSGSETPATFELLSKTPNNSNMNAAKVVVGVYDAATDGSLVGTSAIQRVSKGTFSAGLYTNEATLLTDENGELDFEVIDSAGATVHLDISAPAGFFLASTPSSRVQIN